MKSKKVIFMILFSLLLLVPFMVKAQEYNPATDPNAIINNTVKCPVLGGHPTYMGENNYTTLFDETWVNETDYKEMVASDVFEQGKNYSYRIGYTLKPENSGKFFYFSSFDPHDCQYYLAGGSGGSVSGDDEYALNSNIFYMGNRDEAPWVEREGAILDIDAPTLGGHPPLARANSKYKINDQKWVNLTDKRDMTQSDVFEANKRYKYVINYTSFYDTEVFLNELAGSNYYLGTSWDNANKLNQDVIEGHFYFGDKSDLKIEGTATIENVNAPKAGEALSVPEVSVDAPVLDVYANWQKIDEDNPYGTYISNPTETIVKVGEKYRLVVGITAEIGYKFDESFNVVNNNVGSNFVNGSYYINNANEYQPYSMVNYNGTYTVLESGKTIGINKDYYGDLYPGSGLQLTAFPDNEYNETIEWESNDENVITVDQTGFIWAIAPGTATITATNLNNDSASIDLEVFVPATSVNINQGSSIQMTVGGETTLTAQVLPNTVTDKNVHWYTVWEDDYNLLPLDVNYNTGEIHAIRPGQVVVRAAHESGIYSDIVVTVTENTTEVEKITLDKPTLKVMVGSQDVLHATVTPNGVTSQIEWLSSDSTIASVDQNGEITGHKIGQAIITAKIGNKSATCTVTVSDYFPVTFYDQDGETVLKETINYEYMTPGSMIDQPSTNRENKVFVGWFTDPGFNNKFDFTGHVESTLDLYGKWEDLNVSISVSPNSVDFGDLYKDFENNVIREVVVTNDGNATVELSINNPTSSGPFGCYGFQNGKKLAPGETYTIKLIAHPSSPFAGIIDDYNGVYAIKGEYVTDNTKKSIVNVSGHVNIIKRPMAISYTTHVQNVGWQSYVRDGVMAGTSGRSLRLEGIKIKLENQDYDGNVLYKTHIQNIGWEKDFKKNNEMSGTSGRSLRLEGIQIKLDGDMAEHFDIYYRVHAQNIGWMGWAKNGEDAGTAGYAYRLEGIEIRLVNKNETFEGYDSTKLAFRDKYAVAEVVLNKTNISMESGDVEQINAAISPTTATNKNITWSSNNEASVTVDNTGKITAVGEGNATITATSNNGKKATCNVHVLSPIPGVGYTTHVQNVGWQSYVKNGAMAGTSGRSLRLEGIKIRLRNAPYSGNIEYTTHVQNIGWQSYVRNDIMAGTSGRSLRLEAIRIRLTGEMELHFDIYYRVHAQNIGWMAWAKNNGNAGTAGYAYRLEGIEIVLVNKGEKPPIRTNQDSSKAFIQR